MREGDDNGNGDVMFICLTLFAWLSEIRQVRVSDTSIPDVWPSARFPAELYLLLYSTPPYLPPHPGPNDFVVHLFGILCMAP